MYLCIKSCLHVLKLFPVDLAVSPHGDEVAETLFQLGQLRLFFGDDLGVVLGDVLVTDMLAKWENADFNKDGIIDIFDLGLMKRALLKNKA